MTPLAVSLGHGGAARLGAVRVPDEWINTLVKIVTMRTRHVARRLLRADPIVDQNV